MLTASLQQFRDEEACTHMYLKEDHQKTPISLTTSQPEQARPEINKQGRTFWDLGNRDYFANKAYIEEYLPYPSSSPDLAYKHQHETYFNSKFFPWTDGEGV